MMSVCSRGEIKRVAEIGRVVIEDVQRLDRPQDVPGARPALGGDGVDAVAVDNVEEAVAVHAVGGFAPRCVSATEDVEVADGVAAEPAIEGSVLEDHDEEFSW